MSINISSKQLINLGWYNQKSLFYDLKDHKLYESSISRNSSGIIFFAPAISTSIGYLLEMLNFTFFNNSILFWVLTIFMVLVISILMGIWSVNIVRRHASFAPIELYPHQRKKFIKEAKTHNIGLVCFVVFILILSLFLLKGYFINKDFMSLLLYTLISSCIVFILVDYRPIKRESILNQLFLLED